MISFIVPVFNGYKFINKNYECFLAQYNDEFEIIYVNDGSTDDSLVLLNILSSKDSRVTVINSINQGAMVARKIGFEKSKYKYIAFVDIDDEILPNFVSAFSNYLGQADILIGSYNVLYKNQEKIVKKSKKIVSSYDYLENYFLNNGWELWAKVFSKKILENLVYIENIKIGEDAIVFSQCVKKSRYIMFIPDIIYTYIINSNSISISKSYRLAQHGIIAADFISNKLNVFSNKLNSNALILLFFSNSSRRALLTSKDPLMKIVKKSFFFRSYEYIGLKKFLYVIFLLVLCSLNGKRNEN